MKPKEINIQLEDVLKIVQHDTTNKMIKYLQERPMGDFHSTDDLVDKVVEKASNTYALLLREELNKQFDQVISTHLDQD